MWLPGLCTSGHCRWVVVNRVREAQLGRRNAALRGGVTRAGRLRPSSLRNRATLAVDQKALTRALDATANQIAGAGLDVLEQEPPDPDEPIVKLPNVITFPHMGTATAETRYAMRKLACENVAAVVTGNMPEAIVNPIVLG